MPARACLSPAFWKTIFFDKVPPNFFPGPDFHADVVADVVLEDVHEDGTHGVIHARVKYTSKGAVKAGELIRLHYNVSSCGPYHQKGEDGMIAARYGDAQDGQKILIALTRPQGGYLDLSKMLMLRAAPAYGRAPLTVHFSAPAAPEEGAYRIEFGDGQKSAVYQQCKEHVCTVEASHTYMFPGIYAAILTLTPACMSGTCPVTRTGSAVVTVLGSETP